MIIFNNGIDLWPRLFKITLKTGAIRAKTNTEYTNKDAQCMFN